MHRIIHSIARVRVRAQVVGVARMSGRGDVNSEDSKAETGMI